MIEVTRQLSGVAKKLENTNDVREMVDWALTQSGLSVSMTAKVDNTLLIQAEGIDCPTVYPEIGQWLAFDGEKFIVYATDEEFTAAGFAITE